MEIRCKYYPRICNHQAGHSKRYCGSTVPCSLMGTKPILFNTEMVQAVLADHKLQTRRVRRNCEKPKYDIGDILYVRETWRPVMSDLGMTIEFKAGGKMFVFQDELVKDLKKKMHGKWKPSIFLPKVLSRIYLEVTDVYEERIQKISNGDCYFEGIDPDEDLPKLEFKKLWNSINKSRGYGWDKNPEVFVYKFKKVKVL